MNRPCGEAYGTLSNSGHPCGRAAGHPFDDKFGHVCRCEAERFLENHAPCATPRLVGGAA